jgi:hypothetical protein
VKLILERFSNNNKVSEERKNTHQTSKKKKERKESPPNRKAIELAVDVLDDLGLDLGQMNAQHLQGHGFQAAVLFLFSEVPEAVGDEEGDKNSNKRRITSHSV